MGQSSVRVLVALLVALGGFVVGILVIGTFAALLVGGADGQINGGLRMSAIIVLGGFAVAAYAVRAYLRREPTAARPTLRKD